MFTRPSKKSFKSTTVRTVGLIAGVKASDGLATLLPGSTKSYNSIGLAAISLVLAACVNPSTLGGEFVQSTFLGMAGKQGYNALNEVLTSNIEVQDSSSAAGKFMNALIGHPSTPSLDVDTTSADAERMAAALMWNNDAPVETLESVWERNNQPQARQINIAVA